jgi:hypothetical protein
MSDVDIMPTAAEAIESLLQSASLTHLALDEQIAYEEWAAIGRFLVLVNRASMWHIGSWWRHGEHHYGEAATQALDTGYALSTIQNAAWVCDRIDPSRRREDLEFAFHAEVASLPPDEHDTWLDRAAEAGWSKSRLRENIRAVRVPEPPEDSAPEPTDIEDMEPDCSALVRACRVVAEHPPVTDLDPDEWVVIEAAYTALDGLLTGRES